jgi:hypothetical protein
MGNVACINPMISVIQLKESTDNPYKRMLAVTDQKGNILGYSPMFQVGTKGPKTLGEINDKVTPPSSGEYLTAYDQKVGFEFDANA